MVVLLSAVIAHPCVAQPRQAAETQTYELVLKDGSRIYGAVEAVDEREVVFRACSGAKVVALRADIITLRAVSGRVENGEFFATDTQRTRLFFAPTARSLKRGQVSLGVFEVSMPFVQAGVTDRFSLGGGTPLVFGFDESSRPFWITPKLQVFDDGRRQAAVGVMHLLNVDGGSAGIAYGVGTFGSSDSAATVGFGYAYADGSNGAVLMVGGEKRVTPKIKVITENYVWQNGGIVSGGFRFLGEKLSADLGLAVPLGVDAFFAFPVVNFVYLF